MTSKSVVLETTMKIIQDDAQAQFKIYIWFPKAKGDAPLGQIRAKLFFFSMSGQRLDLLICRRKNYPSNKLADLPCRVLHNDKHGTFRFICLMS